TLHRDNQRVYFAAQIAPSASPSGYVRVGVLGQVKNEQYRQLPDTALSLGDSVSATFGLSADFRRARFKVVTHYNGFARDEDVDLSTRIQFNTLLAPKAFGYRRNGIGLAFTGQVGWPVGPNFLRFFL